MKAATYTTFGEPADVLVVKDVARPDPKAGEVLIRTILSPIHNHDLWTIRGTYGYKPELPWAVPKPSAPLKPSAKALMRR